jgi:L-ribulose-5-phosphate 3-epimerase
MSQKKYNNQIGIMQGRLSAPINGMIQAYPKDTWRDEFRIAAEIGFDTMELIFDGPENPLFHTDGAREIQSLAKKSQIFISSVSTDYTMFSPLYGNTREKSLSVIQTLIRRCGEVGIPRVGISFEDESAITSKTECDQAVRSMKECVKLAEDQNMILTIETSLYGTNLKEFIERVGSNNLKVNFDVGNSCAYGDDVPTVIRSLGKLIGGIHIKDRTRLFGTTVPLGQGDVDFKGCFDAIKEIMYTGPIIIQAARGSGDVDIAHKYLEFVRSYIVENNED